MKLLDRVLAIGLSIVPGFGHVWIERPLTGAFFFCLFLMSLNGLVLALLWQGAETAAHFRGAAIPSAIAVASVSLLHVLYLIFVRHSARRYRLRETLAREALEAYLSDRPAEAETLLRRALRKAPNQDDPDLHFLLGAILKRLGKARGSRWHLKRCRANDDEGRWAYEVERELAAAPKTRP